MGSRARGLQCGDKAVVRVPESSCKSKVHMGLSGKGEDQLERQDDTMAAVVRELSGIVALRRFRVRMRKPSRL